MQVQPRHRLAHRQNLFKYGKEHPHDFGVESVISALKRHNVRRRKFNYDYSVVYSTPWAPHVDIEERHYRLTQTISRWSRRSKILDSQLMILCCMILLLSADDLPMAGNLKEKVSAIQMKYILMLHRYLKDTYPKQANTKFAGGLMLVQFSKELYDMHSMRLPL